MSDYYRLTDTQVRTIENLAHRGMVENNLTDMRTAGCNANSMSALRTKGLVEMHRTHNGVRVWTLTQAGENYVEGIL